MEVTENPTSFQFSEGVRDAWMTAEIGRVLDSGEMPYATTGGVILPDNATGCSQLSGEEDENVQSKERCSKVEQEGAAGRQGTTGQSRFAGQPGKSTAADPKAPDIEPRTPGGERKLTELFEAYPGASGSKTAGSNWVFVPAKLLPGSKPRAFFVCELENRWAGMPRAWGFWPNGSWIGPRHTNSPDGSICAFHIEDATWSLGDSLVNLFDMYSLWAVRHLHLQLVGWWPGEQVAQHLYERLVELKPQERCGCNEPRGRYAECCYSDDLLNLTVAKAIQFNLRRREPPAKARRVLQEFI